MINVTITYDYEKAAKQLDLNSKQIDRAIEIGLKKSAFLVERHSKEQSPVQTGRLRNSISSDFYPMRAEIMPHTNYALYVHDGTRYITSNPFMKRGSDDSREEIDNIFESEFQKVLS